jgi:hypothetical protein
MAPSDALQTFSTLHESSPTPYLLARIAAISGKYLRT